jgi:hypothetical protein
MTDQQRIAALEEAVEYALEIIEAYDGELSNLKLPDGICINSSIGKGSTIAYSSTAKEGTLGDAGFCKGRLFTQAPNTIRRLAAGELSLKVNPLAAFGFPDAK